MEDPNSMIELIKHRGRETATHLLTVDDLIAYRTDDGGMVIEFVRWGSDQRALESYRVTVCPEDATRILK